MKNIQGCIHDSNFRGGGPDSKWNTGTVGHFVQAIMS